MLNQKSDYLVVLIGTYNRLPSLKRTLDSILTGTRCSHEVMVIDAGSTDGTVDYLQSHSQITPIFQGQLIGQSRAFNSVWQHILSQYTCWLSDDTEVVPGSLDRAVKLLDREPAIGMVGLKMRDTLGYAKHKPYMGAVSDYGILNCNHGVLSTALIRAIGYFNETYYSYGIDPDITASVLCTGKQVVMTKAVSVLHHRAGVPDTVEEIEEEITDDSEAIATVDDQGDSERDNWKQVYREKFRFLENCQPEHAELKSWMNQRMKKYIFPPGTRKSAVRLGFRYRDWRNIVKSKFIHPLDPVLTALKPYHLVQQIPEEVLLSPNNPYVSFVK